MRSSRRRKFFVFVALSGVMIAAICCSAYFARAADSSTVRHTAAEADMYVRFDMEGYDIITTDNWSIVPLLPVLFQAAVQDAVPGADAALQSMDRIGTAAMLARIMSGKTEAQRKDLAVRILGAVLSGIAPAGRAQLLTSRSQEDLKETVANVHPANDLYQDLGVSKSASAADIERAYEKRAADAAATSSPAARAALANAAHARDVLSNGTSRTIYDETGAEPTVFSRSIGTTRYVYVKQIAPTTITELSDVLSKPDGDTSLIIDLRGNIGGALDVAPQLLGLFVGANQYAFDLLHQSGFEVARTPSDIRQLSPLRQYRETAVLTDDMTQSTAEIIAASLKRDRIAGVVGTHTRGWGSVEHVFPMSTQIDPGHPYSILLVVYLTLADDQNFIEGRGVLPDVDISRSNWRAQLPAHFSSPSLISAVTSVMSAPPKER